MSRLMADQERRGDNNGAPGIGEEDSIMCVNLAEGGRAVNGEIHRTLHMSVRFVRRSYLVGRSFDETKTRDEIRYKKYSNL